MAPGGSIEERWQLAQDSLVLQSADFSLATLHQMVASEQIDVAPRYQRRERWSRQKQAELIESFLLNMPVPPIYLAEERIGRYSVIDGKQRLTAIDAFMGGQLRLTREAGRPSSFAEVDGRSFEELPEGVQTGLSVRPLRVVTVLRQSDAELKYEVFRRLNESAVPLNPQEIRNVLFRGPMNDLLMRLSEHPFLRQQMKITSASERFKQMVDVEMVLRFLTLRRDWRAFGGDYREAMDDFMKDNREPSPPTLSDAHDAFKRAIRRCQAFWGDLAFRRPEGATWRDQPLTGLFDAEMIAAESLDDATATRCAANPHAVIDGTKALFENAEFDDAVRQQTNTATKVRLRVSCVQELLQSVAGAAPTN